MFTTHLYSFSESDLTRVPLLYFQQELAKLVLIRSLFRSSSDCIDPLTQSEDRAPLRNTTRRIIIFSPLDLFQRHRTESSDESDSTPSLKNVIKQHQDENMHQSQIHCKL